MIEKFILDSGEKERTVESIRKQIKGVLEKETGALWVIEKDEKIVGYFFCEIVLSEYESYLCLIHEVMIHGFSKSRLREIDQTLEAWAKGENVNEMVCFTRRNPDAFIRTLGNGWEKDSVVLKRRF